MKVKVAIIGGGPAGFMAAIVAAENNHDLNIEIIEKKEPLKTILYTGNGRCNISNALYAYKELVLNYPRGEKFLYSCFSRFGVKNTVDFFESLGVKLYTQDDNRMFPRTDDANTIRDALVKKAVDLGIKIRPHCHVANVDYKDNQFIVKINNKEEKFDKLIIASGGNYRKPQDSGYNFAEKLGHSVTELKPALTAFKVKEKWVAALAGVTVKNTEIKAFFQGKQVSKCNGDFIFTHKGISGPLAFKISSYCAFLNYDENCPLVLKINFVPDKTQEDLDREILEELNSQSKKSIENILKQYLPKSVITTLIGVNSINPEKRANQITKEDRKNLIKLLTKTPITVNSAEMEGEIVTAGGIKNSEINPKTMESKLVQGLYFCGEVMNIDGLTGGFNLQACWSTGFIVGISL